MRKLWKICKGGTGVPTQPGNYFTIVFSRSSPDLTGCVTVAMSSGTAEPLVIGLERENGLLSHYQTGGVKHVVDGVLEYVCGLIPKFRNAV